MNDNFTVVFWGVRGSYSVSSASICKFGGNTSCVEMDIGDKILIFDCGTGIINLGDKLMKENKSIDVYIFMTHFHWDHIIGFPFFQPIYNEKSTLRIFGEKKEEFSIDHTMKNLIKPPYFPVKFDYLKSTILFNEVKPGNIFFIDDIKISTINSNHPNGCIVYRVDYKNKSCCYITDHEHYGDKRDEILVDFVKSADIVIYDASFSDDNYVKGVGHSTWQKGIELAKAADIKKLVLFHHNTDSYDDLIIKIENEARNVFRNTIAAREGMIIKLL